jgi:hypothetical protein
MWWLDRWSIYFTQALYTFIKVCKLFVGKIVFFRLEMFTRMKSTAWTGGCFSLKLFKTIYYSVPNSSDKPIFEKRRAKDGHFFNKNTGVRRA